MTVTETPHSNQPQPNPSQPQATLPPGEMGLPFLGETLDFFGDPNFAKKRFQKYGGSAFKSRLLGSPTIFVRGAEANRFVLTHDNDYFQISWPPSTSALLGELSLALQTGGTHQTRRKLLAQAFMPRALSTYVDAMTEITTAYCHRWLRQGTVTWYPELRNYTLDVACKLLVGLDNGSQTPLGHVFETWCEGLFSIPLNLPWMRFGKAKQARRRLLNEIETIVRQRQAQFAQSTGLSIDEQIAKAQDALDLLVQAEDEDGARLSAEELKDQVLLLLFAGHETLTSAIATFCLQTALHPDILNRIRAEQDEFREQSLTLDTLKQMTYLEQVLKEVLRFTPPVGGGFRKVLKDCEFEGYKIPAGWMVLYQIGLTHYEPDLYENPEQFDPDRFSPERSENRQKYGYVPFGGGIRECLGKEFARLEMKIFAALLARDYDWQLLPDQDLSLVTIPTPRPRDNLRIRFQSRSS